ncbi:hypothetical protein Pan1_75 [Pseudanabaena phage Pan1]|nr:hypothetical protein Pan1_75 [Pseudanabaena phage Pan1]
MQKGARELLKQLPGWEATLTRRHIRLVHKETGAVVITSSTPSDHRTLKNTLAQCRRAVKGSTNG